MQDSFQDVVDTAIAAGNFTQLTNALRAANLVDTLRSTGPFTVFAPTDAAFKKLPAGALNELLKDKAKLTSILTHHMLPIKLMARDFKSGDSKTVNGSMLTIDDSAEGVRVAGAKVTKTDLESSNGVIHGIDTVVMPT